MNKWLPIFFGCHTRKDRSFKGFPICARCTGELFGIIISPLLLFAVPNLWVAVLIMMPLVIDGFFQLLTKYESNNTKRFITGLFFGIGLVYFFIQSIIIALNIGVWIKINVLM